MPDPSTIPAIPSEPSTQTTSTRHDYKHCDVPKPKGALPQPYFITPISSSQPKLRVVTITFLTATSIKSQ